MQNRMTRTIILLSCTLLHFGCGTNVKPNSPATLADLDVPRTTLIKKSKRIDKSSLHDVKLAYQRYLDSTKNKDSSHKAALSRLADLELQFSNSLLKDISDDSIETAEYTASVNRTAELLETQLLEYPKAVGNDRTMYQLAQAYEKLGNYQRAILTLDTLCKKHPESIYYPEAQFRIAEAAFAEGDYISAEDAYTEVILAPDSKNFYEKSLFKRGWSRYKQQIYLEAIPDYIAAFNTHRFPDETKLTKSERPQYEEFFRAIALALANSARSGNIDKALAQTPTFKQHHQYKVYEEISRIFVQQKRYSDAVYTLQQYISHNKLAKNIPLSEIKIIDIWQLGGFTQKAQLAFNTVYENYQPNAAIWGDINNKTIEHETRQKIRNYIVQIAAHHHKRFQSKHKKSEFDQAQTWYKRYLANYTEYANKDNMHQRYADLLLKNNKRQALYYLELAAYDGDIILNKDAALQTIHLTSEFYLEEKTAQNKSKWLQKYLINSKKYVELFPQDERSNNIAISSAVLAYKTGSYAQAIDLANYISGLADKDIRLQANNIKAGAYLELSQYAEAEQIYLSLLKEESQPKSTIKTIQNSLALSIFRQGEIARDKGNVDQALHQFLRVKQSSANSPLIATGIYEAATLTVSNSRWSDAIPLINHFIKTYPSDPRTSNLRKSLSTAYLSSNQQGNAAKELEKIADLEQNLDVKRAAVWRAAELFETEKNFESAIRNYRTYAHTYSKPFEQNLEAMYRLTEIYKTQNNIENRYFWQIKIRNSNHRATVKEKTERTEYLSSRTTLDLAHQKLSEFNKRKLTNPLKKSLKLKKTAMKDAISLFGQASTYGITEITTEATHTIGDIYLSFGEALLNSDPPKNLAGKEIEQYYILLEDQAFAFEEKAIEFYETNIARTAKNTNSIWIDSSHKQLNKLFPVRYNRKGKIRAYHDQ